MPSAQAKKRAERKKQQEKERMAKATGKKEEDGEDTPAEEAQIEEITQDVSMLNQRGTSGVLSSHPLSADIHIHNFSMTFHGKVRFPGPDFWPTRILFGQPTSVNFLKVVFRSSQNFCNAPHATFFTRDREGNADLFMKKTINFATWWRHFSCQSIKIHVAFSTTFRSLKWRHQVAKLISFS